MTPLTKRDGSSGLAVRLDGGVEIRSRLIDSIDPTVSQVVYVGLSMHRLFPDLRNAKGRLSEGIFMRRSSVDPTTVLGMGLNSPEPLCFFYLNPVKNRIDFRAVDEFVAMPSAMASP